jgi:hypothetical protein
MGEVRLVASHALHSPFVMLRPDIMQQVDASTILRFMVVVHQRHTYSRQDEEIRSS